jgi:spore coat protein A
MSSHNALRIRSKQHRYLPWLELMEDRQLLSGTPALLDPSTVPKFVNPLPQPLDPSFVYKPTGTTTVTLQDGTTKTVPLYQVGAYQVQENLGLGLKNLDGRPVLTTVYGYGATAATATYPGQTFVVQSGQPIAVQWINGLTATQHILPVDPTVMDSGSEGSLYTVDPSTNAVTFPDGIPIDTHVHGGHTDAAYDGTPEQWFTPDQTLVGSDFAGNPYVYDNSQQAATIWYHDHAVGITRLNVYAGLAGFYIVHDNNENNLIANHTLPSENYDVPLAIQDRQFTADGQLYYPADVLKGTTAESPSVHPEFFGDTILVNGQAWPVLNVEPRVYRFRVLDGSQARFYNLQLNAGGTGQSQTFYQIGTDDGLLSAPVALSQLLVAPGERADILIDFSKLAGQMVYMTNNAKGPYPKGEPVDPATTGQIMAFKVSLPLNSAIPDATPFARPLNSIPSPVITGVPVRPLGLFENDDSDGRLIQKLGSLPLGSNPFQTPIAPSDSMGPGADPTTVQLVRNPDGSQSVTELWQVYNITADTHPIHLHSTTFQIVSRQKFNWKVVDGTTDAFVVTSLSGQPRGPDANENGWKDTARMNPGEVTSILVKFDLPGNYVWHCHILEHEEHDMMNQLVILAAPQQPATIASTTKAVSTTTTETASAPLSAALAVPTTPARLSAGAVDGAGLPPTFLELGEVPPLLVPDTADCATPAPITLNLRKGRSR